MKFWTISLMYDVKHQNYNDMIISSGVHSISGWFDVFRWCCLFDKSEIVKDDMG